MCRRCQAEHAVGPGTSRRRFLGLASGVAASLALPLPALAKATAIKPQSAGSPAGALERLMKGNVRYVQGISRRHDFMREREVPAGRLNPYAGILSCADSRVAPEYAFDSGRGDLFVCRVAGNFANDDTVASLEYAVAIFNTPLIVVLGHESCGTVRATIESLKGNSTLPGHLPTLVSNIAPAVKASLDQRGDKLQNAIRRNVIDNAEKLKSATPIISSALEQGKLKIVGGVYHMKDGRVEFID
jgi:carbonic anhydrase